MSHATTSVSLPEPNIVTRFRSCSIDCISELLGGWRKLWACPTFRVFTTAGCVPETLEMDAFRTLRATSSPRLGGSEPSPTSAPVMTRCVLSVLAGSMQKTLRLSSCDLNAGFPGMKSCARLPMSAPARTRCGLKLFAARNLFYLRFAQPETAYVGPGSFGVSFHGTLRNNITRDLRVPYGSEYHSNRYREQF